MHSRIRFYGTVLRARLYAEDNFIRRLCVVVSLLRHAIQ